MSEKTVFGHPAGLMTLFFTEMWERFSYYGMRALLVLYMTDSARRGLAIDTETAGAIYGLYTFGVYALALPGGWIADRVLGQRRTILIGGVVIAAGHYTLGLPLLVEGSELWSFYLGLVLVVIGTGLLKPNVSAIVGELYSEDEPARRDAGFSIFYMGINLGAFLGPILCGWFAESVDWHVGFSLAGIGMTLGLVQYVRGGRHLDGLGGPPEAVDAQRARGALLARSALTLAILAFVSFAFYLLDAQGVLTITVVGIAQTAGLVLVVFAVIYFAIVMRFGCRDAVERQRVGVIFVLFLGAAVFWSGFEQAGSSMNLYARDYTDRVFWGWELPTTWLQSVNAMFIVMLAPFMGMLWIRLGARSPSIPMKFALGLILLGAGFFVLAWGALQLPANAEAGPEIGVSVNWLVVTYFFHTVGELALSPVGLSSVTKLSPRRLVGQMMGTWFMGTALGNLLAGLVAGQIATLPPAQLFSVTAGIAVGTGILFMLFTPLIRRMMHGIS
ncbi:MAG: peptide MFS transporter [Halieaceae bacterium]|nr:peptide MFS transporter [Halieaceae bacterium]